MVFSGGEEVARFYATIGADTSGLTRGAALARAELAAIGPSAVGAAGQARGALTSSGIGLGVAATAVAAVGGIVNDSIGGVMEYETAFTGVRRTVEGSREEFDKLDASLRDMATKTLPVSREELAAVATIGGQMGIAIGDIPKFVDTVVRTSVSTNGVLGIEETAQALGRLAGKGLLDMPISELDKLGSAILKVGDESKANEQEVVDFALRLAGAGKLVGMSRGEIVAMAAALPSLGINAEAGGTAISQVWMKIQEAVSAGGKGLETLGRVSGMSADEFARVWRTDPGAAFNLFLDGVKAGGKDIAPVFDELGFGGVRATDTLLRLASDTGEWRKQTEFANQALADGKKIIEDSGAAFGTTSAELKIFHNNIRELKDELGGPLVAALSTALPYMSEFVRQMKGAFDGKAPTGPVGAFVNAVVPATGLLGAKDALGDLFGTDSLSVPDKARLRQALMGGRQWPSDAEGDNASRGGTSINVEVMNVGLRPDIPGGVDVDAAASIPGRIDYAQVR